VHHERGTTTEEAARDLDRLAGRLGPVLDEVLAAPFPAPPDMSGADRAARRLLES